MYNCEATRAALFAPIDDEPGEPRAALSPDLPCVLVDHFELPLKHLLVQVECKTCGKWFLEGGQYPCAPGVEDESEQRD